MPEIARRDVLKGMVATGAGAALPLSLSVPRSAAPAAPVPEVALRWLEDRPALPTGSTWGTPWPKGVVPKEQSFALAAADGAAVPVQSWPLAYWPDGSLKWTAHAISDGVPAEGYTLRAGTPAAPAAPVTVKDAKNHVDVDTGVIRARIRKDGPDLIGQVWRGETEIARRGRLVNLRQDRIDDDEEGTTRRERYLSDVRKVTVEQPGPVRAVVRVEGRHQSKKGATWLPFTVRLYFYAGADSIRMMHTFVFDRDGRHDFIAGLGVRFSVPMRDEQYDRHVRFVGDGHGMLAEAVKGITGLRRDPGAAVRAAQVAGTRLPAISTWDTRVSGRVGLIPAWGDHTLSQLTSGGFSIKKRTAKGFGWVDVDQGRQASGFGYAGGVSGGLAFGLRDFWQRHPAQLDIRGAASDEAEVTVWMWSPEAGPMDTRFYHDGMGQDTYPEQLQGLEITYEDYEPGFGTPYGVARTSELTFWALGATPDAARLAAMADAVRVPPQVVNPVGHLVAAKVFGGLFSPVDRSSPAATAVEDHLDFLFSFYRAQVEQRHWYGFWNHGDIMHTFDTDRRVWRYDVGGYAWDNSELSPDLWLWYAFLRSGRADVYRFAEAMTRHTGEVDVYHLGPWAGLGTRHNVQHWGCSAKQQRISTAAYRRIFYYLTADERAGDLMRALVDSDRTFMALDPLRKIRTEPYTPDPEALAIGLGTDWSGLAAAWLTEWERGGDPVAERKLKATMRTIAAMPNGFVTGEGLYSLTTGEFAPAAKKVAVSHLSAMFGEVEICAELIDLVDMPEFERAWLQYCRLFNGTAAEQTAETGAAFGNLILRQGHSRLTAYAAVRLGRDDLAARAWREFYTGDGYAPDLPWRAEKVGTTLNPTDEAAWVSTNTTALYGLAAIQNLALVGGKITPPFPWSPTRSEAGSAARSGRPSGSPPR
ncbi:exo-rhamnogalacturonan lyase family protein [Sphaerisporangium corydalis]|uniref:Tat pathway signal sequence domain protein n=1 Tax=Sphaerisporangium corydalis TaxID=1441875 RepID=A0ABV9EEG0_9ACTN|nr:Tat pathway signal sequence domain protein [Sphaerisporangium corydalis]